MTTREELVEAGAKAMFESMRTGLYAATEWAAIAEVDRQAWLEGFDAALVAVRALEPEREPEYRVYYVPKNSEGEKGVWYADYHHRSLDQGLRTLAKYRRLGFRAVLQERWYTQWREVRE
jgi:hypothetical protein